MDIQSNKDLISSIKTYRGVEYRNLLRNISKIFPKLWHEALKKTLNYVCPHCTLIFCYFFFTDHINYSI